MNNTQKTAIIAKVLIVCVWIATTCYFAYTMYRIILEPTKRNFKVIRVQY